MDMAKLNDWLQIVGIFAVVASLIFVGLQLKQTQEIAIAGQYQQRFDSVADFQSAMIQSAPAMRVVGGFIHQETASNEELMLTGFQWIDLSVRTADTRPTPTSTPLG